MDCPLQTGRLCSFNRVLGVKRATCKWTVLRECGQEPLQFYRFRVSDKADRAPSITSVDLHTQLCWVWIGLDSVEPRGHNQKRITYHCWLALLLNPVSAEAAPYKAPR
eukprot:686937-Pelagomonas_calceolata.AAC.1